MKLTFKEKYGYGIGAIGLDLSYGLVCSFFMSYATDSLHISSVFMGIVLAAARIWDGINDPIMGTIVNNTRSKWGRFRPWIMIGAVINSLVLWGMFTNPGFNTDGSTNYGMYAYIAVAYILWGMSYTLIDIPYWSFVPALTSDPKERNVISSIPRFFSGMGQLLVAGLTPILLPILGKGNPNNGYSSWALILGVLFIFGTIITVSTTKEKIVPKTKENVSLAKAFKVIKSNDQLLVFILTAIAFNTGWYLTNGLAVYFFTYVAENLKLMTYFAIISGIGQALGLFCLAPLSKKIGKHNVVKAAMFVTIIGYIGMFFTSKLPTFNFILFAIFGCIGCIGIGCMFTAETSMLADIVDYGEFKSGERNDSIIFSMKSFLLKFSQSIQALVIGLGLKMFNYQENVVPQPTGSKNGIVIMMFAIPPILAFISFLIFQSKYKLHSNFAKEVSDFVLKRHEDEGMNA